jgi:[ribosomal protein S5]-alanine N-acetyltransferase
MEHTRLETERLVLRPLEDGDVDPLFALFSDAETLRYWSRLPMTDRREARAVIDDDARGFAAGSAIRWGLARRDDGRLIGTATLFKLEPAHRRAEIGYILERGSWGRGYMREALAAVLAHGFGALALHRIEADVHPGNAASIRLLEHFGFVREGLLRERWRVGGEVSDSLVLGLLEPAWTRSRASAAGEASRR